MGKLGVTVWDIIGPAGKIIINAASNGINCPGILLYQEDSAQTCYGV
jgi:hypothetical protein